MANITMYGADWCSDCRRAKMFFAQNNIAYQWHDVDTDSEARKFVRKVNHGNQAIPTIVFEDGSILVEPSNSQLAKKFSK